MEEVAKYVRGAYKYVSDMKWTILHKNMVTFLKPKSVGIDKDDFVEMGILKKKTDIFVYLAHYMKEHSKS